MRIYIDLPGVLRFHLDDPPLGGELLKVCQEFGEVKLVVWPLPVGLRRDQVLITDFIDDARSWEAGGGTPIALSLNDDAPAYVLSKLIDLKKMIIACDSNSQVSKPVSVN